MEYEDPCKYKIGDALGIVVIMSLTPEAGRKAIFAEVSN
jgi:hypothetical protein